MKIPPLDLTRQYKQIKNEIIRETKELFEEQTFILGETVKRFEDQIAEYCGTKYAVGCANGTDAILLSLMAIGIKKGDEVLVPSFTFIASAEPIARIGARPVFCDIDSKTYNIDPDEVTKKVTHKTKAIIVVHLYGQTANMTPILAVAKKRKIAVIEDACQAIGAVYGPQKAKAGSIGDLGCFSFFPSKNLGGFGDGGIITTNNKKYAEIITMLRQHGSSKKYYHEMLGLNSRLDALQAVVLAVKLKYLDEWLEKRRQKADQYGKLLKKRLGQKIEIPYVEHDNTHTYHQYVLRINNTMREKRDALLAFLHVKGIGANVYYPVPCHLQNAFRYLKYKKKSLRLTEEAANQTIALPIYPELTIQEQKYIVETIESFFKN